MSEIKINQTYMRSSTPYDVVRVLDIIIKSGKAIIKCIYVYGSNDGPFYVSVGCTKEWQLF